MTIDEASKQYNIPKEVLLEYEKWGLCDTVKKVMGAWQYDDSDLERLSMIMTLRDIGFENSEIVRYMELVIQGDSTAAERMRILKQKREHTLDELHFQQKRIDHLDYLRYELQKNKKEVVR